MKAHKVGEVTGGATGKVFDVYYQDISGIYRLTEKDNPASDLVSRVVGSAMEAMKAAEADVKSK